MQVLTKENSIWNLARMFLKSFQVRRLQHDFLFFLDFEFGLFNFLSNSFKNAFIERSDHSPVSKVFIAQISKIFSGEIGILIMEEKHIWQLKGLPARLSKETLDKVLMIFVFVPFRSEQCHENWCGHTIPDGFIFWIPHEFSHKYLCIELIQNLYKLFVLPKELNFPGLKLLIVHPCFQMNWVLSYIPMKLIKHDVSSRIADTHTQSLLELIVKFR